MGDSSSPIRLVWHRRDLRLHDNALYQNLSPTTSDYETKVVSLYIFDHHYTQPQSSTTTSKSNENFQTIWNGPHALSSLLQTIQSHQAQLQSIGGELFIRHSSPRQNVIPTLLQFAKEINATEIHYSEEPGTYETQLSQELRMACFEENIHCVNVIGYTLFHPNDLPSSQTPDVWNQLAHPKNKHKKTKKQQIPKNNIDDYTSMAQESFVDISPERFKGMCNIMGDFRKTCRNFNIKPSSPPSSPPSPPSSSPPGTDGGKINNVRRPIPSPTQLNLPNTCQHLMVGTVPTFEEMLEPMRNKSLLGLDVNIINNVIDSALANHKNKQNATKGEVAALQTLHHFLQHHATTADRSKADVSNNDSSKISAYLAMGSLSPRTIYYEAQMAGQGCEWLMSHLEMRDFFLYTTFKAGKDLFQQTGLPVGKKQKHRDIDIATTWNHPLDSERLISKQHWNCWATGTTNLPLIDAGMKELMCTGYCSNRVRQNMASVFTKDLHLDWRLGAEWFQFLLEDYCTGANWGNWLYFSGVGPDPKQRHFRTVSQALRYDPKGVFVMKWLPELKTAFSSRSDDLFVNDAVGVEQVLRPWDFSELYQNTIVDPSTQYTWQDLERLRLNGRLTDNDNTLMENESDNGK